MKFEHYRQPYGANIFSMIVNDMEISDISNRTSLFYRFQDHLLQKLANMVSAYYFKHHKDQLVQFVNSDECKQMIVNKLVESMRLEVK